MGMRVGLIILLVLGVSWACDARELETDINTSVLQIIRKEPKSEIEASEKVDKKENVCTLCEEFAGDALNYLSENKTQIEIIKVLHKSCSKLLSFKQECITLVDYYAPLFFLEITSVQPGDFCSKVNLCEEIVSIKNQLSKDSCGLCHNVIDEALIKLKDPDTQLEIIELLLKGCNAMENYKKKCKRLVFEYGPLILVNAEEFLEGKDICTILHACNSPKAAASI